MRWGLWSVCVIAVSLFQVVYYEVGFVVCVCNSCLSVPGGVL